MILWLDEDAFDIEGPTTERNIVGVAHFYACANPLTLLIFSLRAMYHDSTERVLGSKSLENDLLWTSVNVLLVSPVVQKLNNCMCYEQIIKYLCFIEFNVAPLYKRHQ